MPDSDHQLLAKAAKLFGDYSDCLTKWERNFIEEMTCDMDRSLTQAQREKLDEIVDYMETAEDDEE